MPNRKTEGVIAVTGLSTVPSGRAGASLTRCFALGWLVTGAFFVSREFAAVLAGCSHIALLFQFLPFVFSLLRLAVLPD